MRHNILTLFFLLLSSGLIYAQHNSGIKGTIKDYGNHEVLSGVTVFVEELKTGTSSDENGHYEIHLPSGSYNIKFSFVGYISETKQIEVTNSVKTVNINLKSDNKILNEVLISSQRKDANVRELKMSAKPS